MDKCKSGGIKIIQYQIIILLKLKRAFILGIISVLLFNGLIEIVNAKPDVPLDMVWSIKETPKLNQVFNITLTVTALLDTQHTTVEIILPEGLEFVSGDINWKGDIKKNNSIQLRAIAKAVKIGEWTIKGNTMSEAFGKSSKLFLLVTDSQFTSKISNYNLMTESQLNELSFTNNNVSLTENLLKNQSNKTVAVAATSTVWGYWKYLGKDGVSKYPIRYAKVELWEDVWYAISPIASGTTDAVGKFLFTTTTANNVYVKIEADSQATNVQNGVIVGFNYKSKTTSALPSSYNGATWIIDDATSRGAWAIFDDLIYGFNYFDGTIGWTPPKITAVWYPSSTDGSHYDYPITGQIHLV